MEKENERIERRGGKAERERCMRIEEEKEEGGKGKERKGKEVALLVFKAEYKMEKESAEYKCRKRDRRDRGKRDRVYRIWCERNLLPEVIRFLLTDRSR